MSVEIFIENQETTSIDSAHAIIVQLNVDKMILEYRTDLAKIAHKKIAHFNDSLDILQRYQMSTTKGKKMKYSGTPNE